MSLSTHSSTIQLWWPQKYQRRPRFSDIDLHYHIHRKRRSRRKNSRGNELGKMQVSLKIYVLLEYGIIWIRKATVAFQSFNHAGVSCDVHSNRSYKDCSKNLPLQPYSITILSSLSSETSTACSKQSKWV